MSSRIVQLRLCMAVGFVLLFLRLIDLQVVHGKYFRQMAEQNRLRVVPEEAPRGLIVDRNGRILAGNQTVFHVAIIPQEVEELSSIMKHISGLLDLPIEQLKRSLSKSQSFAFMPATLIRRVPKQAALNLEEQSLYLRGLFIKPEIVRHYPMGKTAAHLLGYLGMPDVEELPVLKRYGVRPRHLIGRTGLERLLDSYLRGRSGGAVVEIDNRARQVGRIGHRRPQSGQRVELTIDSQLQSLIEASFGEQAGAATVIDPKTGELLAMVSIPTFQPESFVSGDSIEVRRLLRDPQSALINRAAMGQYAPGSIAKLLTASAALESGVITPSTTITCTGFLTIGDRKFHCWNRDGHGPIALTEALKVSCNVYFMQVGRWLGLERLRAMMMRAGWGRPTGWVLSEQAGRLPTGRRFTEGEVAILAIGQGEIEVTTLQAAVMVSAIANGGWLVKPWVVKAVGKRSMDRMGMRRLGWKANTLDVLRRGMREAVLSPHGTAHRAFTKQVSIGGKTGTAQTHLVDQSHGWFVGFCPVDGAQVAMAIVAEYGGSGGDLPAEIARTICEYISLPESL